MNESNLRFEQSNDRHSGYFVTREGSNHRFRLGIEIGSLDSFFSLENPEYGNARILNCEQHTTSNEEWKFSGNISLNRANFRFSEYGQCLSGLGRRTLTVSAEADSLLMDCVIRFVINNDFVRNARIGDEVITHENRNKYSQRPQNSIRLDLTDGSTIVFRPNFRSAPDGMSPVVYLRDERGKWVIHFRLLATKPDRFCFKGCSRYFNRPFPGWIQRVVANHAYLRKVLLYVRERVSQRIPFQLNGGVAFLKGQEINFSVEWTWI